MGKHSFAWKRLLWESKMVQGMSGVEKTEKRSYIEALKKLVNLQLQYAIIQSDEIYLLHMQQIMQENSVLGAELKRVFGDTLLSVTKEEVMKAKETFILQCRQAAKEEIPLFLEYLLDVFGANSFERHCIRLLYAFELDKCYGSVAALLQDGWEYGYVTPYLAQITYEEEVEPSFVYETFSKGSLLERFFIKIEEHPNLALLNKIKLTTRMLDFAMGNIALYEKYAKILRKQNRDEPFEGWIGKEDGALSFLEEAIEKREEKQILYLYGEEGSGKRFSVFKACEKKNENCILICLDEYEKRIQNLEDKEENEIIDEIVREIILFQAIPVIQLQAKEKVEIGALLEESKLLREELLKMFSILFLCAEQKVQIEEGNMVTYLYRKPMSLLEGKQFWEAVSKKYKLENRSMIGDMANKFQLTKGKIKRILEQAEKKRIQRKEPFISKEILTEECYEVIEQRMGKKAIKVPAVYNMEDLILPEKQKRQLMDACNQVKYKHMVYEEWGFQKKVSYGKGVSMAFIGSPGTGKTMAAQVIAKELGMELYKVELSAIVSKYVGETEKNLDEIFEQARKSQVILFFDEADALFSKRSEGKETNDKYSNMEAAFLLQKMEGYEGITILATNLFHHFDEAFKRRLKIIVEFPLPGEKDRKHLWKTMIPEGMLIGEVDFDYLAKQFELSGSNIRNILLHSAFLAAAKGKAMDMEEIIPAIKNEYAKNGKHLLKEDVSEYYMYLD